MSFQSGSFKFSRIWVHGEKSNDLSHSRKDDRLASKSINEKLGIIFFIDTAIDDANVQLAGTIRCDIDIPMFDGINFRELIVQAVIEGVIVRISVNDFGRLSKLSYIG